MIIAGLEKALSSIWHVPVDWWLLCEGEPGEMVLAKQLLAWNQHNKRRIGEADDDPEPVQRALDKVRSVLQNGD